MTQVDDSVTAVDSVLDYPLPKSTGECPFDPPAALQRMREQEPVAQVRIWDGSTPWLATGYDEVRALLADPRISADTDMPLFPHFSASDKARRGARKPMTNLDGKEHDDFRRLIARELSVKQVEKMRPGMQTFVDELIDQMLAGPKPADLMSALAFPVPGEMICQLLGVPSSNRPILQELVDVIINFDSTPEQAVAAQQEMFEILEKVLDDRLAEPGPGMFSRLAQEYLVPGQLTRDEVVGLGQLLLMAGLETTASTIALGITALLQHPDTLPQLRESDDPQVLGRAIEELLRWLNPASTGRRRVAIEDVEIAGKLIKAGDGVITAQDVADRDPSIYDRPNELDINREPNRHMAFAFGIHQCPGQNLARVELQVVLSSLIRRIPTLQLAVDLRELSFRENHLVYGVRGLPVTW